MVRVAIFVENRLSGVLNQQVYSDDRRMAGLEWQKLGPECGDIRLCARLTPSPLHDSGHVVSGTIEGLPYYHGLIQAILKLPALVWCSVVIASRADLVVTKTPGIIGVVAAMSARLTRTPLVVHLVGDAEDVMSTELNSKLGKLLGFIAKKLTQRAVLQAEAVRYPTRIFLQGKYPASHPESEFWFTDAAINPLEKVRSAAEFVPGRILAIGSQERMYKGHDFLIRALPLVQQRIPHAHLVLVGKGACREQLESLVDRLGLNESVRFVDFLDGWGEVSEMMKSAHVFAMPSLTEGLPRALIEAMSLGVACVGSDAAGIPELLPGRLVVPKGTIDPLAGLLARTLEDPGFRAAASEECLERSRQYSADTLRSNIASWQCRLQELI